MIEVESECAAMERGDTKFESTVNPILSTIDNLNMIITSTHALILDVTASL